MMYLTDFENAINDYLTNCSMDPEDWDVEGMAAEMRGRYEVDSIDDIDTDEFTDLLERFAK